MSDRVAHSTADPAERLRAFNRFYTQRIGVLHEGLLQSPCSLTESRLLWELAHASGDAEPTLTATALARRLGLDLGYVSRLLGVFRRRGWVHGERVRHDGRQVSLRLTPEGRAVFGPIDARAHGEAAALLAPLGLDRQQQLMAALDSARHLLEAAPAGADRSADRSGVGAITLRGHRPGDIGWVIQRHAELYAREYGWDERFEALVARIAADFVDRFDPSREACWMAERRADPTAPAERLGCVFLVQARHERSNRPRPGVAQLRMLIVDPTARGLGLGRRLVTTCTDFARQAGYRRIVLWTNSLLLAARHLYVEAGYRRLASEPHHSFGHDLVGETWELRL